MKRLRRTDVGTREFAANSVLESNRANQITPPSKKRKLQFGKSSNLEGEQGTRLYENFRQLDSSNPVEAKRINTRKKQVEKGKNTVGYDLYIQKVPKHTRKKILEHPSTPDYKADIPNRRWLGQLKAWRISLHQYDPKDIKSDLTCESKQSSSKRVLKISDNHPDSTETRSVKYKQIEDASKKGLSVDFDFNATLKSNEIELGKVEDGSTDEAVTSESSKDDLHDQLDKWEANRIFTTTEEELLDYDDSDDDLL